jgi:hypothetical protein
VRITPQAVAREARVSSATLYRFPDLVKMINEIAGSRRTQTLPPAQQRRLIFIQRVAQLEARVEALLSENLRLTRILAKYDPELGEKSITSLDSERSRRRAR